MPHIMRFVMQGYDGNINVYHIRGIFIISSCAVSLALGSIQELLQHKGESCKSFTVVKFGHFLSNFIFCK